MSNSIRFTPLLGSKNGPDLLEDSFCGLLEINQYKVLLDCGLPDIFPFTLELEQNPSICKLLEYSKSFTDVLKSYASSLDAILISHCDIRFVGALPLIIDQLDPRCNILATAPVSFFVKNVILNNYDEVCQTYGLFNDLNATNIVGATNPPFTKVQIESVFRKLIPLRYYQSVTMNNKSGTIHFSPYPSGSTIGGAFWRIKSPESDILYAVEFDLKKGQLLDCAKFESIDFRPTLLIIDSRGSFLVPVQRQLKYSSFLETISSTLVNNNAGKGGVLIPIESPSKILELSLLLNSHWTKNRTVLSKFPIFLLSSFGEPFFEITKGLPEWINPEISERIDFGDGHFLELEFVKFAKTFEQIHASTYPCVVICGSESINSSKSIQILSSWANLKDSLILFTKNYSHYSLANELVPGDGKMNNSPQKVSFLSRERVPLSKSEILKLEREQRNIKKSRQAEDTFRLQFNQETYLNENPDLDAEHSSLSVAEKQLTMKKITSPTLMQKIYWPEFSLDAYAAQRLHFLKGFLSSSQATFFHFNDFQYLSNPEIASPYGYLWSSNDSAHVDSELVADDNIKDTANANEIQDDLEKTPFKLVTSVNEVEILTPRKTLIFSQSMDNRSLRFILSSLNPNSILLIGGDEGTRRYCHNYIRYSLHSFEGSIFVANNHSTTEIFDNFDVTQKHVSVELNALNLLRESFEGYSLGLFSYLIHEKGTQVDLINNNAPQMLSGNLTPAKSERLLIGDPKINEIKRSLQSEDLRISLQKGELVIEKDTKLKKEKDFLLNGTLSESFFATRRHVQLHVIELHTVSSS